MKLAARAVDVDEGERARVRAVGQENEGALALRVIPATRAREAQVAEAVRRKARARGRVGHRCELPADGARLLHPLRHVRAKEDAGLRLEQLCEPCEKLCAETCRLGGGRP